MKFCVALISYWQSIGFDTSHWRKSNDGLYAIAHYEFIKILKPDIDTDINIQIKEYKSAELEQLLAGNFGDEPNNIDELRVQMIEKMNQICEYKIINEFYSDCLGTSKKFDCEPTTDQVNIAGLVSVAMAKMSGIPVEQDLKWKASGEQLCYPFAAEQIMKLGFDLHKHKTEKIEHFEKLRVYINDAARTEEEIKNVTWEMVL